MLTPIYRPVCAVCVIRWKIILWHISDLTFNNHIKDQIRFSMFLLWAWAIFYIFVNIGKTKWIWIDCYAFFFGCYELKSAWICNMNRTTLLKWMKKINQFSVNAARYGTQYPEQFYQIMASHGIYSIRNKWNVLVITKTYLFLNLYLH